MKKRLNLLLVLSASALLLAGCGKGTAASSTPVSSAPASSTPVSSTPTSSTPTSSTPTSSVAPEATYTITWMNYDGTTLETDTNVKKGATPTYDGATPTKAKTTELTYTFSGWGPSVIAAVADATYVAQFSQAATTYSVTWKNYDGTTLETDDVAYGATPTYAGSTPVKAKTTELAYTFSGWDPAVVAVASDATYTAQFTESASTYSVTWKNEDGTVLETDTDVPYGTVPTFDGRTPRKAADASNFYIFEDWDAAPSAVTGDATYTATYTATAATFGTLSYTYWANSNTYSVKAVSMGTATAVVVPETYDDGTNGEHPVSSFSDSLFINCSTLVYVEMPDTITSFSYHCFEGCTALKYVTIPSSLEHVNPFCFKNCSSLESVALPAAVTGIEGQAFAGCTALKDFSIDAGNAKYKTDGRAVYTKDGAYLVVYAASGVSGSYSVLPGVKAIYSASFTFCAADEVILPDSVTTLNQSAFLAAVTPKITIPVSVTSLKKDSLYSSSITSATYGGTKAQWQALCTYVDTSVTPNTTDLNYPEIYKAVITCSNGTLSWNAASKAWN